MSLVVDYDIDYEQLLITAATEGNFDAVIQCIQRGISPNITDRRYGFTALVWAVQNGFLDIVQYLIEHGADMNKCDNIVQSSPLHLACYHYKYDVVKYLLEQGCRVNCIDKWGGTPMSSVVPSGHYPIAKLLVDYGVDLTISGYRGSTPLTAAVFCHYNPETFGHVISLDNDTAVDEFRGYCRNCIPADGYTTCGHIDMIQLFLDQGMDINFRNHAGQTALSLAVNEGHNDIVKIFLERGADPNTRSNAGETPLLVATRNGYANIVQLLISAGAYLNLVKES